MNIFKGGLGIVLVVLAVFAMLVGACGPSEVPPAPSTPSGNQPPEISSLTASPSGVSYGGSTTVKCIATDPDGDVLDYSWSASGGDISGDGDTATWVAPDKAGNFYISVILSDGKGGETTDKVMVTVSAAVSTVTITPVAEETGTVRSDGGGDNFRTWAGDDEKDRGYCAFWSFDVSSLAGKNIQSASLKFTTKDVVGDPFPTTTGLGGLTLQKVTYSDGLPRFKYTGTKLRDVPIQTSPPTVIDVTQEIINIAAFDVTRFQVEALFEMRDTNGNHIAQFIEWSGVVLEVTYSDK
ncbi:Ig-like domain-containing protein [Chloroflexota bacterium]